MYHRSCGFDGRCSNDPCALVRFELRAPSLPPKSSPCSSKLRREFEPAISSFVNPLFWSGATSRGTSDRHLQPTLFSFQNRAPVPWPPIESIVWCPKAPGSLDECPDLHVGTHALRRIAAVIGGLFDHHDTDSNRTSDAPSPPLRAESWALTLSLPLSETTKTVPRYRKPCKPGNAFQPRTPSTTEYLFEACPIPQHATSRGTTLFARGSS